MENIGIIFQNKMLIIPIIVLLITQGAKIIYFAVKDKKLDVRKFLTNGGLPSSHSALVSSLATSVGLSQGFSSAAFAVATILALIVMHDAAGVRRAAGEHAKVLNKIIEDERITIKKSEQDEEEIKLKELLGHTKKEVYAGLFTGIILTILLF